MIWKNSIGNRILWFPVQLPQQKVKQIIHIEEALNIEVHITQQGGLIVKKKKKSEAKKTNKSQAQGIQARVKCFQYKY